METINDTDQQKADRNFKVRNTAGRIMGGLIVVGVGSILLAQKLGVIFPEWIFTWQMLLIVIGVFIGFRSLFRNSGWIFPIMIGGVFMIDEFYPGTELKEYLWPAVVICGGLFMILRSGHSHRRCGNNKRIHRKWEQWHKEGKDRNWEDWHNNPGMGHDKSTGEYLDSNAIFGGIKKNIVSKDFKGGEINCFFGGAEINLMNADISGTVHLEINNVFGGTKLIVPANWELKTEMSAVLGGIEDKRHISPDFKPDPNKVLILEGNCVFGGIEICSY